MSPAILSGLAGGLILLTAGGELLVRGSARLGHLFGVPRLVIGLTIVSFGTSAPELAVSLQAVGQNAAEIAIGNVVGSNIFNVLFILGVSAMVAPLLVGAQLAAIEVPIMIAVSILAVLLAWDGAFSTADGLVLLGAIAVYLIWMVRVSRARPDALAEAEIPGSGGLPRSFFFVVAGLGLLVFGARLLVAAGVEFATTLGVDEAIVGLTIVAAGTSLPEAATSIVAAWRGEREIAVGNIVGSNIFNLTVIVGLTSVWAGGVPVAPGLVSFDMVVMLAVAVACLPVFITGHRVARWEGSLFLLYYVAYTVYLVLDATAHSLLPAFSEAMLLFAIPLTGLTLILLAGRSFWKARRLGGRA